MYPDGRDNLGMCWCLGKVLFLREGDKLVTRFVRHWKEYDCPY
jgi:hypothetical protein